MSEQTWYIYQQNQQLGPFTAEQLHQMITIKMIAQDAYLFKVGWKDWRPIEEVGAELGLAIPQGEDARSSEEKESRRLGAPRASIKGRIVVHNNGQVSIGHGVNISATGIFIETQDEIFNLGEELKISVKVDGIGKPFNTSAKVVRFNNDPEFAMGYGLQFIDLPTDIRNTILEMVRKENSPHEAGPIAIGG